MPATTCFSATASQKDLADERCERRYPSPEGVTLILQAPPDAEAEDVDLRDISLHGFGLLTSRYLEPGSPLLLRIGTQRIDAEVRHCSSDGHRFRTGVVVHHATSERPASPFQRDWDALLVRSRRQSAGA